jgi:hypothetical protein
MWAVAQGDAIAHREDGIVRDHEVCPVLQPAHYRDFKRAAMHASVSMGSAGRVSPLLARQSARVRQGLARDVALVTRPNFIGSHTIDRLIDDGHAAAVIRKSQQQRLHANFGAHPPNERFLFVEADDANGLFVPVATIPGSGRI